MRHLHAVNAHRGHLPEGGGFAELGKCWEAEAVVFERDTANGQCQPNRFGAATVKVEVVEFELGHVVS